MLQVLDPEKWLNGVERLIDKVGVLGAAFMVLMTGLAMGFAFRGPGMIAGLKQVLDTILTHRRECTRINDKIERENRKLASSLEEKIAKKREKAKRV